MNKISDKNRDKYSSFHSKPSITMQQKKLVNLEYINTLTLFTSRKYIINCLTTIK